MRLVPVVTLSGCLFITAADREERAALLAGDTAEGSATPHGGDDDDDTFTDEEAPAEVVGGWRDVSVGSDLSCAVDDVGQVSCWASFDDWYPPIPDDLDAVGVSVGLGVGCAWDDDGETRCFGEREGSTNNPEPAIDDRPGTFDVGTVDCGVLQCCGLSGGMLVCFDDDPVSPQLGFDTTDGLDAVSVWGNACTLNEDGAVDCMSFVGTGGADPDDPFDTAVVEELDVGDGTYACGRTDDDSVGCWDLSRTGTVETMDVAPSVRLTDLHALDNGGVPYVCGLAGGAVTCEGTLATTAPPVSAPEGNWTHLSMHRDVGCVLDGADLTCWGTGDHRPR